MVNITMRQCKKCHVNKPVTDFRRKIIKDKVYYEYTCKSCQSNKESAKRKTPEYRQAERQRYSLNKETINNRRRIRYVPRVRKPRQSKEERLGKIQEWQKYNPEKRKKIITRYHDTHKIEEAVYREANKVKIAARTKEYRRDNRGQINKRLKARRENPIIGLRHSVSCLVRLYIKGVKNGSILQFLTYTIRELKIHLEKQFKPWMSWDNWGKYNAKTWNDSDPTTWTWQIDHIIPQSKLPYTSMTDDNFRKCWALDNLRPLSAKQNVIDGATRKRHTK